MSKDCWNPAQYEKFKDQRSQPFHDLAALVAPEGIESYVDLGCGTGELTATLAPRFPGARGLGIDNSEAMLAKARAHATSELFFAKHSVDEFTPTEKFDLIFSNAALQWLPDHPRLFPRIFSWLKPSGQIAIQMPANFDHPSHRIAYAVASRFPELKHEERRILAIEDYAVMLHRAGFKEQNCFVKVYMHPMDSGAQVIEWTRGTLLTQFEKALAPERFAEFLTAYRRELLTEIGEGPYPYSFKRMLLWGRING